MKQTNKINSPSKRGRSEEYPIEHLKKIALKVKKEINGAKLTKLKLEKLTGIGRNTWSRKIPDFIDSLNNHIPISREINSSDDVYYPNFSAFLESYDGDINRMYNELNEFELQYQKKDSQVALLSKEVQSLKIYKEEYNELKNQVEKYKIQADHYKTLYEHVLVGSAFPHLRKEHGIKDNLLKFTKNTEGLSLKNLEKNFSSTTSSNENEDNSTDRTIENMKILKQYIPDLLNKNER